ncbi:hypothetical protein V9T40_014125 [Parthenolecanium corni]|uniref:Uncharacterized protein n=1 Tax=Parthenolecanium corni TaxID=536013 RepID=A0AAN9TQC1_9HEMI
MSLLPSTRQCYLFTDIRAPSNSNQYVASKEDAIIQVCTRHQLDKDRTHEKALCTSYLQQHLHSGTQCAGTQVIHSFIHSTLVSPVNFNLDP